MRMNSRRFFRFYARGSGTGAFPTPGQSISGFPSTLSLTMGQTPYTLPVNTDQGLAVTYVVGSGPATVSSNTLTLTGAGTVVVNASQAGNGSYSSYSGTETITVTKVAQTLNSGFLTTLTLSMSDTPYTLPTETDQGNALTYAVSSGPATVSGNTLTLTAGGTVVITASQAGTTTYASFSATETITVTKLAQSLSSGFPPTASYSTSDSPVTLPATTDQGLTISYAVASGPATVSSNTLTLTGAGTVVVNASQSGNGTYSAWAGATETITVSAAFAPTSLSGLYLWLDGQDNSTITQSSGAVSQWNDKSGSGNNVTASGSARPTLTASAINSKQALVFDGSANTVLNNSAAFDTSSGITFIAVWRPTSASTEAYVFSWGSGSGFTGAYQFAQLATEIVNQVQGNNGTEVSVTNDTPYIWTVTGDTSGNYASYLNSAPATTQTQAGALVDTGVVAIGSLGNGTFFWNGTMGEVLVYNRPLDSTELTEITNYLAAKWGITV